MQFPNSPRTRETERLMFEWRKDNPNADTAAYNAAYVRIYESLTGFSESSCSRSQSPRSYVLGRRAPKHRSQTKGAFGKPKHLRTR